MPVQSDGIHGNAVIQCHTISHFHDGGSQVWTPPNLPPTKYHIVEEIAIKHT
jgi:hypothetical protein